MRLLPIKSSWPSLLRTLSRELDDSHLPVEYGIPSHGSSEIFLLTTEFLSFVPVAFKGTWIYFRATSCMRSLAQPGGSGSDCQLIWLQSRAHFVVFRGADASTESRLPAIPRRTHYLESHDIQDMQRFAAMMLLVEFSLTSPSRIADGPGITYTIPK